MTMKQTLQKILQVILYKEDESKQNHERSAHTQILKQKQLNGRNHYIPININTECQWTQVLPSKDTIWQTGLKRDIHQSVVYK
jgi:hypothetical protein